MSNDAEEIKKRVKVLRRMIDNIASQIEKQRKEILTLESKVIAYHDKLDRLSKNPPPYTKG